MLGSCLFEPLTNAHLDGNPSQPSARLRPSERERAPSENRRPLGIRGRSPREVLIDVLLERVGAHRTRD